MRRGVTAPLACLWIGAAFALAVLLAVVVPGIASAGAFKCENWWLYEDDEMRLRAAALKALPKHAHLDEVGPCRNPDLRGSRPRRLHRSRELGNGTSSPVVGTLNGGYAIRRSSDNQLICYYRSAALVG